MRLIILIILVMFFLLPFLATAEVLITETVGSSNLSSSNFKVEISMDIAQATSSKQFKTLIGAQEYFEENPPIIITPSRGAPSFTVEPSKLTLNMTEIQDRDFINNGVLHIRRRLFFELNNTGGQPLSNIVLSCKSLGKDLCPNITFSFQNFSLLKKESIKIFADLDVAIGNREIKPFDDLKIIIEARSRQFENARIVVDIEEPDNFIFFDFLKSIITPPFTVFLFSIITTGGFHYGTRRTILKETRILSIIFTLMMMGFLFPTFYLLTF